MAGRRRKEEGQQLFKWWLVAKKEEEVKQGMVLHGAALGELWLHPSTSSIKWFLDVGLSQGTSMLLAWQFVILEERQVLQEQQ